jgi:hypothetical protein
VGDLPGLDELKATGLLRPEPPASLFAEARAEAAATAGEGGVDDGDDFEDESSVAPMRTPDEG